jgi:hypothetical protein
MDETPLPTAPTPSAWFARPTLFLFAFLTLTSQLPAVLDIYSSPLWRVLFVPSYLVMLFLYDAPWGLENAVYALDGAFGSGKQLWEVGLFVTYYLFAVVVTWLGRRLTGRPNE